MFSRSPRRRRTLFRERSRNPRRTGPCLGWWSRGLAGITQERVVAADGIFWPCPSPEHPCTPRLFLDRFGTADGRARFHAVEYRLAAEEPDEEFPLYLTTGRVMQHYQSGTQTRRVRALNAAVPESFVEVHPSMAVSHGIQNGDAVRLTTRRGSALVKAHLTNTIRMDTLFVPFHFGGHGRANLLTNPELDPVSRMPEFKVCAVSNGKGPHMLEKPTFLQGIYSFTGVGRDNPAALTPHVAYKVPYDKRAQLVYFRAGNPSGELIYVVFLRDGKPMRYFPVGAKSASHVELAVVEDLEADTVLEILIGAPAGLSQSLVLDIGLVEIS